MRYFTIILVWVGSVAVGCKNLNQKLSHSIEGQTEEAVNPRDNNLFLDKTICPSEEEQKIVLPINQDISTLPTTEKEVSDQNIPNTGGEYKTVQPINNVTSTPAVEIPSSHENTPLPNDKEETGQFIPGTSSALLPSETPKELPATVQEGLKLNNNLSEKTIETPIKQSIWSSRKGLLPWLITIMTVAYMLYDNYQYKTKIGGPFELSMEILRLKGQIEHYERKVNALENGYIHSQTIVEQLDEQVTELTKTNRQQKNNLYSAQQLYRQYKDETMQLKRTLQSDDIHSPTQKPLIFSFTNKVRPWTQKISNNQQLYCNRYSYEYQHRIDGNITDLQNLQPQWSKIFLLKEIMENPDNYGRKIVWTDDDIVFTNHNIDFIKDYFQLLEEQGKHILIAKDAAETWQVNTGIILLINTPEARAIINTLWEMKSESVDLMNDIYEWRPGDDDSTDTLGNCVDICLHEQDAINYIIQRNNNLAEHILTVLPYDSNTNMNINTFNRKSDDDKDYSGDPQEYRFKKGFTTCHATGMEEKLRMQVIEECLGQVVN